jgi:hypothetical protein
LDPDEVCDGDRAGEDAAVYEAREHHKGHQQETRGQRKDDSV